MRRPLRWALNFWAVVSAVMFVGVCALACGCPGGPGHQEAPPAETAITGVCYVGGYVEFPGAYPIPRDGLSLRALLVSAKPLPVPKLTSGGEVLVIRRWRRGEERWDDWIRVSAEPLLTSGAGDFQLRPKDEIMFNPSTRHFQLSPPDPHRREMTQPAD